MGFPRSAAIRATSTNFRPSLNPSTNPAITFVSSSSSRYRAKSQKSRSASFPVDTMYVNPMPSSTARFKNGPNADAPLWHTSPIGPLNPAAPRDDALAQMSSFRFARPRQLGPLTRIPDSCANRPISPCRSRRSSTPRSANPAEITMADFAPFSWLSRNVSSTAWYGTTTPTTSGASGSADTDGYACNPCTSSYRGFTGYTLTPRSIDPIAAAKNRPPYCIRGVAPTTAIDRGFNIRSIEANCASLQKGIALLQR